MKRKNSLNKGFTLIELMIGLALWMLVALAVVNLSRSGLRIWKRTEKAAPMHQEARVALNELAREFRNSIDVPGIGWKASEKEITFATVQADKISKVTYQLAGLDQETILKSLHQELIPDGVRPVTETPLTRHRTLVTWEYAYLSPTATVEWRTEWRPAPEEPMPGGIRVHLTLFNDKAEPESYTRTLFAPAARSLPWAQ